MQFFVNGAVFASFVPRLPEIRDRIDITTTTLGALLAIAGVVGLSGSASVGSLISRFGSRRVMITAAVALTFSLATIGVATSPIVLLVALMGMATFDVLVDAAMNLQGSWLSARRATPVMNRLHALWSVGTVIGGFAASRVAAAGVSLRDHLLFVAVLMLGVVAFVGRGLLAVDEPTEEPAPPSTADRTSSDETSSDETSTDETSTVAPSGDRRRSWRRSPLLLLAIAGGCSIAMEVTSSDWAAFRLSDDFDATAGVAGLAFVAFTAGMTTGRFGGDWAFARFGQRRVFRLAIAVTFVALAVASFAPNRWLVLGAYGVAGLGIATQFPKLYDDAAQYRGKAGAGLGALTGGSKVALLVTPAVVGALAGTSLSVGVAVAIVTLPTAAGFVLVTHSMSRPAPA